MAAMDQVDGKRAGDGKNLPRSPSSVLEKLALKEAEALEVLRLSDHGDEPEEPRSEEAGESSRDNPPAAGENVSAASSSLPAPPRPLRSQLPVYAQGRGGGSPAGAGHGQGDWHPHQNGPASPVYFVPHYDAYGAEAPLGSPGMVAHPYAWHYGGPFQVYPGSEIGPPVQGSPRSPGPGCMQPGSPCSADYYCMAPPMPFMPGVPMPGMGGPPMVLGPNGPVPAGMVMPPYGAPQAYPPGAGLPPRFAGAPQSPVGVRPRVHRTADDLDKFRFNVAEARSGLPTARTTVMIKNVPNKYTQRMLLDTFDRRFRGQYDFFYLPIDYKNKCNLGYCFMNFLSAELTAECYDEFHNKRWEEFNSKKARSALPALQQVNASQSCLDAVAEVCYAKVQGCNGCIEHFKNAKFACLDADCLPLVFVPADAPGEPLQAMAVSPRQPPPA